MPNEVAETLGTVRLNKNGKPRACPRKRAKKKPSLPASSVPILSQRELPSTDITGGSRKSLNPIPKTDFTGGSRKSLNPNASSFTIFNTPLRERQDRLSDDLLTGPSLFGLEDYVQEVFGFGFDFNIGDFNLAPQGQRSPARTPPAQDLDDDDAEVLRLVLMLI